MALNLCNAFVKNNEKCFILIVVPTQVLKDQWIDQLEKWELLDNCRVEIINTVVKKEWTCNLLIIDEIHVTPCKSMAKVFIKVKYDNILGLTATFERLDGNEKLISKFAPVCDTINIDEAEENGWVAPHKEYLVLLDVDLTEYNELTRRFNADFAVFDWDFNNAMKCATDYNFRRNYAKSMGMDLKMITATAMDWNRCMTKRKNFIQNHPKKLEIVKKIINARSDKKIITFSSTIKQFNNASCGILNTSKSCDAGIDIIGVNCEIIMNTDSSRIKKIQRVGRAIRFEEGKTAEIFTLILKNTTEVNWFNNSNTSKVITINEEQLEDVLSGKEIITRERERVVNTKYRF